MPGTEDPDNLPQEESLEDFQEDQKDVKKNDTLEESLQEQVESAKLQEQVVEFKEKYLRSLADSENQRKRLQKERQELVQYAVQGAILDFLSPIDHLENALKFADQGSPEVKHWAVGFQMILEQFKDALSNNGVTAFVSVGKPFDPHWHEAVEMIETNEQAAGTVVEESLRGYKMADKVLRPARVKVAKAPTAEVETNQ